MSEDKITVQTRKKREFVEITDEIEKFLKNKEIKNGICIIFVPHTTCGLTINENADPSVKMDIINKLEETFPEDTSYLHTEGNADAHIKSTIVGHSLIVFIEDGYLKLGRWQGIFLCEFDGPRIREVWIKIISC